MAGISSLGVGSGIDIRNIVDQLVAAERAPVQSRLDRSETTLQAELSSFGVLKSALSGFKTAVEQLSDATSFRAAKATSSNSEAVSVSGSDEVRRAASFDIQVDSLAQSQSLASGAFASVDQAVGSGSLTFRFGTVTVDGAGRVTGFSGNPDRPTSTIAIPADSSSLTDLRDAVNDADIGVTASVINDGAGERLVFSASDTGAANGFLVDVVDHDGDLADGAGLSRLQFNESSADLTHNRAAADASLVVDGLTITRPENQIDDLLEGATLSLLGTTTVPVDVRVEPDVSRARELINGFVNSYNELQQQIDSVAGYDAATQQGGVLQGNALVRGVQASLRRLVTERLDVLDGQSVRALADIGITTNREGNLEIDAERLDARLADSLDEVAALFGTGALAEGSGLQFVSSRSETRAGRYDVTVTQLARQAAVTGSQVNQLNKKNDLVIDKDNDEIELTVNGIASGRIVLTQGTYADGAELAAELQSRINGSAALQDEGIALVVELDEAARRFTLRTVDYGSESSLDVTFTEKDTEKTFGFSTGQSAIGEDLAGTIGGVPAEGFGNYLTAQSGPASGLKVEINASQPGYLGEIRFSRGVSSLLEQTLDGYLDSDGPFDSATDSLRDTIQDIGDERVELAERLERLEARLVSQFSVMDAMVAQLNQTSSFLTRQLSGLEALARNGGKKGGD